MRAPHGSKASIAGRSGTKRTKNWGSNPPGSTKQGPENFKTLGVFSWWCREMVAAPGKHLLHVWLGNGVSVAQRS